MYSSAPNNRADPNKRAGRKFQALLMDVKGQMDTYCCLKTKNLSKNIGKLDFHLHFLKKLVSFLAEKS